MALLAAACLAGSVGDAAAAPEAVLASGLTEPGGLAQTPDGDLWISDGALGVCRVRTDPPGGLVQDGAWCGAPDLRSGPVAPTQVAFDPASSSFYVGDGSSAGGAVWRLRFDPATRTIASGAPVAQFPDDRVLGVAVSPAGDVHLSTKRSGIISRIGDPGGVASVTGVGAAQGKAAASLADAGGTLFISEAPGVTRLPLAASATSVTATSVPGLPGGVASAVAADAAGHNVYAGTTNANGRDQVDVLDVASGDVRTAATGFAGVTALLAAADGSVYVADDPAASAAAVGVTGRGRLWRIPPYVPGRPEVSVTSAPAAYTNAARLVFRFRTAPGATFACSVDGAPEAACGAGANGLLDVAVAEGLRTVEVWATDPVTGLVSDPMRRTVVVDRTAPVVTIDSPVNGARLAPGDVDVAFSADEPTASFTCSVDGAAYAPCDPPLRLAAPSLGTHVVRVAATDAAGNLSRTAMSTFVVAKPPPPPVAPQAVTAAVIAPAAGAAAAAGPVATPAPQPGGCERPGRPRVLSTRWAGRGRALVVRLAAEDARYARVSIRSERSALPQRLGSPTVALLLPGSVVQLTWHLRREQLPPRRRRGYTLSLWVARCRAAFGPRAVVALAARR